MARLTKIVVLLLALSCTQAAPAQNCALDSEGDSELSGIEKLQNILLQQSPFVGAIEKKGKTQPFKLAFTQFAGEIYAFGNLGNTSVDGAGDRDLYAKYDADGRITLKGNTIDTLQIRKLRLHLDGQCNLSGKKLALAPQALEDSESSINSKTAFADYLIAKGRFTGKWYWSGFSNAVGFHFSQSSQGLMVDFSVTTNSGIPYEQKAVPVWLFSPGLMRIPVKLNTHNAFTGPITLWREADGSLAGVSFSSPDPYKLKLKVKAEDGL